MILLFFLTFALSACSTPDPSKASFEEGMEAYTRGDYKAAVDKWQALAKKGDAAAQTNLGYLYYEGKGVPQSYPEALKWYNVAILQGYPEAMFNLGVAYAEGKGVERNVTEALRLYRLAAEAGYAPAQVQLGNTYFRGDGVPADPKEGLRWYAQAAEQGDVVAQFLLANVYISGGEGVTRDLVKAYEWLTIAATADHPEAKENSERGKERIAELMTPAEIAEAEKLAKDWLAKKPNRP
jgi:uncharacterized protein